MLRRNALQGAAWQEKGHEGAAVGLWNNLLQPPGKKDLDWYRVAHGVHVVRMHAAVCSVPLAAF